MPTCQMWSHHMWNFTLLLCFPQCEVSYLWFCRTHEAHRSIGQLCGMEGCWRTHQASTNNHQVIHFVLHLNTLCGINEFSIREGYLKFHCNKSKQSGNQGIKRLKLSKKHVELKLAEPGMAAPISNFAALWTSKSQTFWKSQTKQWHTANFF